VNTSMPYHVINSVAEALNQRRKAINGSKILLLGVSYKKDVDDLRESPSLKLMQLLNDRGAIVDYNDPYFPQLHKMRHYDYSNLKSVELTPENLAAYDCVMLATDHSSYDMQAIVDSAQLLIDTRNATRQITRNREKIVLC